MRIPESVPPLGGRVKQAVTIAWWALFALTLVSITAGLQGTIGQQAELSRGCAAIGLRCASTHAGVLLGPPIDRSLVARGVHAGLRVVAFDGHAPGGMTDALRAADSLRGPEGGSVRVQLADEHGAATSIALKRHAGNIDASVAPLGIGFDAAMSGFMAFSIAMGLATLGLAMLLFLRGRGAPAAVLVSFGLMLVMVDDGMAGFGNPVLFAWSRGGNALGGLFIAAAPLLFPGGRFTPRWTWFALLAGPPLWAFLYFGGVQETAAYLPVMIAYQVLTLASVVVRYRRAGPGIEQQQIKWAALGFGTSMACYGLYILSLPWLAARTGPDTWLTMYGQMAIVSIGTLMLPAGFTIALVRYRLYDAESAVSRSVAYGALTLALLGIFAGSEKVIEMLGERYFGDALGALAGGIGAAIAAVMFVPLHHRMNLWAEQRFQKDLIRLRDGLPLLVGDLRETASLVELAQAVLRRCEDGVRSTRGAIVTDGALLCSRGVEVAETRHWLSQWQPPRQEVPDCDRDDRLFPMRIPLVADGVDTLGWLLLGPRPDGSFYGKDEREALARVGDPVARALAIVRRREARAADWERRIAALESAFGKSNPLARA
jgi:hypothetical protein